MKTSSACIGNRCCRYDWPDGWAPGNRLLSHDLADDANKWCTLQALFCVLAAEAAGVTGPMGWLLGTSCCHMLLQMMR